MWILNFLFSTIYRNSINTLVILILILEQHAFASPMSISACFTKSIGNNNASWCQNNLRLCGDASFAYNMSVSLTEFQTGHEDDAVCLKECINQDNSLNQDTVPPVNYTSEVLSKCNGQNNCSLVDIITPQSNKGGILQLSFFCNDTGIDKEAYNITTSTLVTTSGPTTWNSTTSIVASTTPIKDSTTPTGNSTEPTSPPSGLTVAQSRTDSDDPFDAAIAVSVVIAAIIVVVVVTVMMYRRGKCKLRIVKCTERYDNHSPDMNDAYAMSSRTNADPTYNVRRDVDVNCCDVDYCEIIDNVRIETDGEYSHVNLKKKQAVYDSTYNHIGRFNNSSGNTEQTYNHVGDETFKKTDSSTLQPDMYSHIGTMAKPASGQLVEDSYAYINGVIKNTSLCYETKQYDVAVIQSNGGPTGGFGHQERDISGKEKTFKVVGPSKVDSNNIAPVSHSYFVLEKHEKEA